MDVTASGEALELETCDGCGFDRRRWSDADVTGTLRALGPWWSEAIRDIEHDVLHVRPAPATWSIAEYLAHSAEVITGLGWLASVVVQNAADGGDPIAIDAPDQRDATADDAPVHIDLAALCVTLSDAGRALSGLGEAANDDLLATRFCVGADTYDLRGLLAHAVHDATHHLFDVGRGLREAQAVPTGGLGVVAQVSASDGGVPKKAAPSADISFGGFVSDRQSNRKHHGRPFQAVCLWSQDVIDLLVAEGHPIAAGCAGENVTVSGIDWVELRPGTRMRVGSALLEISGFATPCRHNDRWFAGDMTSDRISQSTHPGWSRAYAWVIEPGSVAPGDDVEIVAG